MYILLLILIEDQIDEDYDSIFSIASEQNSTNTSQLYGG